MSADEQELADSLPEIRLKLDTALNLPSVQPERCIIGEYCHRHGFVHGAEAEELRAAIQKALANRWHRNTVSVAVLLHILEQVDSRDSLAWLEVRAREEHGTTV